MTSPRERWGRRYMEWLRHYGRRWKASTKTGDARHKDASDYATRQMEAREAAERNDHEALQGL